MEQAIDKETEIFTDTTIRVGMVDREELGLSKGKGINFENWL